MQKHKKNIEPEDKIIQDMMSDFELARPSDNFTKNTMNEVMHQWASTPTSTVQKLSQKNKIWIAVGTACAFILAFIVDFKHIAEKSSNTEIFQFQATQHSFAKAIQSFNVGFENIPTLVYVAIFGVGLLLLLDKIIGKLNNRKLIL